MAHCEEVACTGADTICKSQSQRITRLRASKKELEGEVRALAAEVGQLQDHLKTTTVDRDQERFHRIAAEAEVERLTEMDVASAGLLTDAIGEVDRLRAERDRYKVALERIASGETGIEPFPHRGLDRAEMKAIAAEGVRG